MRMRNLIHSSTWARVLCVALLVLFVLVCGVHLSGALHDDTAHGIGFLDAFASLFLIVLVLAVLARAFFTAPRLIVARPTSQVVLSRDFVARPPAEGSLVPLRC